MAGELVAWGDVQALRARPAGMWRAVHQHNYQPSDAFTPVAAGLAGTQPDLLKASAYQCCLFLG